MDTTNKSDDLARAIRDFTVIVTETLQGRDLSREQAVYYQAHPKEWHGRMFDALMTSLSEARKIYNSAMGIILQNATKIPALKLNDALRVPCIFGPDLKKMADCWEVDKDLSYEQFGTKFEFPPPSS
jgi:hypothetical protein